MNHMGQMDFCGHNLLAESIKVVQDLFGLADIHLDRRVSKEFQLISWI